MFSQSVSDDPHTFRSITKFWNRNCQADVSWLYHSDLGVNSTELERASSRSKSVANIDTPSGSTSESGVSSSGSREEGVGFRPPGMLVPECMEEARSGVDRFPEDNLLLWCQFFMYKGFCHGTTELASMGFVWLGMLDLWRR